MNTITLLCKSMDSAVVVVGIFLFIESFDVVNNVY